MKKFDPRRLLSMLLAIVMVLGMLPTGLAVSPGDDGTPEMNEALVNRETLAPIGASFNIDTLLEWTPESDPDAAYSRASIPLADRSAGDIQVNYLANPDAKLMLCAMPNSDHDDASAQGTDAFFTYAFNYWQYADSFIYWTGSDEGIVCCPTGEYIDAAHTNGVPIVATLGFPWGSGYGYVEQVDRFCQKAEDGSFPVADKLIEVMDYYGFDGYFFNQESYGCSQAIADRLNEMMRYMHAKRPDMLISWYDSMISTGGVSYQDAVNSYNKSWMEPNEEGIWGVDEFFMNYNWSASKIATTINTLKSIGRSQFDAFAGFNVQANVYGDRLRDDLLVDEDGIAKLSLALYYVNQTITMAKDGEDFHKTEQAYYVNSKGDPRDTSANLNSSAWAGMSRFFVEKTPITAAPFVTNFNTGHGKAWFVDGEKLRDTEWSYQSAQDVLPTYTWIIDSTGDKLEGSYDFSDAYNGGSSVKFSGNLNAANSILLYATDVEITNGMTVSLTAKGGLENASVFAYVGDGSVSAYDECEKVSGTLETGDGWVTTSFDFSPLAGMKIYGLGLEIDGNVADYQINLGRMTIIDKNRNAGNGPAEIVLEDILYRDAYAAEARISWSKVTGASSYEIYKVNADGTKTFIMETPNTAYYIPNLVRNADETDVTIEIVALNRNGKRGTATELTIDWAYDNDSTERVVTTEAVNVCLGATVTAFSEQGDGAECDKALDGISGNSSKWWASGRGDWFSIDLGEPKTIKRIRMEHAEFGGEGKELNTSAYTVAYKDASGNWVTALKVTGNTDAYNDLLLDNPVTAQEWKLTIDGIGPSPWSAVNIYEWQMFETGFAATENIPMQYASAANGEGADDTFTLKNVPASRTVKVYTAEGTLIGEKTGSGTVTLTGLDFGTAEAGFVHYTVTETGYDESIKLCAKFDAEDAPVSEPAEDVSFAQFSQPGSVSSSRFDEIYTTMTVSGLSAGDVVYVQGRASMAVAEGETSISIDRVLVKRAGGELNLQVKRAGKRISEVYTVATPAFAEPTATVQVFAENESGETLTGVRFDVVDANGETAAQMSTTSDSGAKAQVELGAYTIRNTESPEGYGLASAIKTTLRIEGETKVLTVIIPTGGENPEPTDPTDPTVPVEPPVEVDPADDTRDIPLSILTVSTGNYEPNGGASEGPAELAVDNDTGTIWHTDWYGTSRDDHWFQFEIDGDYNVDGLRILPRQAGNTNGIITEYEIQVSEDGETFHTIASGEWAADREWKLVQFPAARVKFVRMYAVDGVTDNAYVFASAAEIRITGEVYVDPMPPVMEPGDDSWDIPVADLKVSCGDYEPDGGASEGPAELALDGNPATMWHTDWQGTSRENHWFQFEVNGDYTVCGLRYLPRQTGNENGTITEYQILVSDDGENFTPVAEGNWEPNSSWKIAQFRGVKAKYVRLVSVDAVTDNSWVFASAAELRLTYLPTQAGNADKTELNALIAQCELIEEGNYTAKTWQKFQKALTKAQTVSANPYASQAQVDEALAALVAARDGLKEKVEGEGPQIILHLDSGRKYFSKDWHIALLNELAAAGYTHVQLAFGNNGLRFVLDDMTIEANGTTYDSDELKEGIRQGNYNYGALTGYYVDGAEYLTETEMDEIIAHGKAVGVEIIPHLNMPGHMSALLDAMEHVGISNPHFTGRVESDSSVDLTNEEAINFMYALTEKYAEYFASKGVKYFHIGADEYANDAYNGSMGFPSMGASLYAKFAEFVNNNAEIVKRHGMTPRAWNDGLYYGSYTSEFDDDIEINYWSSGWWGYTLSKASTLNDKGHGLINTNGDYYFILGKDDRFTPGTSTEHDPYEYDFCANFNMNRFMDGSVIEEPIGGMFCIWADYPGAETEQEVAANIRLVLRAMALGMEGLDLDGMNTDVIPGGFNEDGSINGSGETPDAANKEGLNSLIAICEQYEKGNYTDESWNYFQTVLAEARTVAADPNATQAQVDDVTVRLSRAMTGLQEQRPVFYAITVGEVENGTVTVDRDEAQAGETVTVTATPAEGYKLTAIYVNGIAIEGNTFEMPERDVVVTAAFESDGSGELNEYAAEAAAAAEKAQAAADAAKKAAEEAQAAADEAAASAAQDKAYAEAARQEAQEAAEAAAAAQKAADDAAAAAEAAAAAADEAAALAAAEAAKHAQSVAELNEQIAAAKAEMAQYLKDAQKAAEEAEEHEKATAAAELATAKYEALIALALAADPDNYDAATAELIEAAINAGIEAINAAETVEAVGEALGTALAEIKALSQRMPFVDVKEGDYFYAPVLWAVSNGITKGTTDTTFSPGKKITRAEAITFLWRDAGCPEPENAVSPFVDVKEGDYFFKAVLWAVEEGIAYGLDQNHFGPYASANRAQVVTFLWRAAGSPAASVENPFTDVAENAWFHDAVLWAVENGITTGVSATFFDAWSGCNRAQVVTFLYRAN